MRRHTVYVVWIVAIALAGESVTHAAEFKAGDTVVVIAERDIEMKIESNVIGKLWRGSRLAVDRVDGKWLWAKELDNERLGPGWIDSTRVIAFDAAEEYFTTALQKWPKDDTFHRAWDHVNRGIVRGNLKKHQAAKADFDSAIELKPDYWQAYNNRGNYRRKLNDYEGAIADYRETQRLNPKGWASFSNHSCVLSCCDDERFRDSKAALELARTACEKSEWKQSGTLASLAAAYAELGKFDVAVEWQSKAIQLAHSSERDEMRKALESYRSGKPWRFSMEKKAYDVAPPAVE